MVVNRYPPHLGGVETHAEALAARVAAAGHEVEVITQDRGGGDGQPQQVAVRLAVRRFAAIGENTPYPQSPALWRFLRTKAHSFDLVHAHSYHATPALAAALSPCRALVFTAHYNGAGHSTVTHFAHFAYRPLGRLILRRARRVICVSRAEANLLSAAFPACRERIVVIPNGLDSVLPVAEPWPGQVPTVLYVGRLEPYKNVERILASVAHLDSAVQLVVIGEGRSRPALERMAQRQGMSGKVRLLGEVPRDILLRWMRTARTQISMSEHEAFGIAVGEALAMGTPVVASDIPAHREFLERATAGSLTLVPLTAPTEVLAGAIQTALKLGPQPAMSGPNWDEVAQRTLRVYEEAMAAPGSSAGLGDDSVRARPAHDGERGT